MHPTQGSAFHELVVLPTFAPHLARPYQVTGTEIVYDTEFSQNTQGTLLWPITQAVTHDLLS